MTDTQNEKLNMHLTVSKYCHCNSDAYSSMPVFGRYVGDLDDRIANVKHLAEQQSAVTVHGITVQKNDAEEKLVNTCMAFAGALYVYAADNGDTELMEKASINSHKLRNTHGNRTLLMARNIAKEVEHVSESLTDYGITESDYNEYLDMIDHYEELLLSPRAAINLRKQYTGNLAQQLTAADVILRDGLDKLIIRFKTSDPAFYEGYKNARTVSGGHSKKRSSNTNGSSEN